MHSGRSAHASLLAALLLVWFLIPACRVGYESFQVDGGDGNPPGQAHPGSLDPEFGDEGWVVLEYDRYQAIVRDPQGRILLGGARGNARVARFFGDGEIDDSFGEGGQTPAFGGYSQLTDLAVDSNGRIVTAGWTGTTSRVFVSHRLTSNGQIDPDFGIDGQADTDASGMANTLAIRSGDGVVLGGSQGDGWRMVYLTSAGILDEGFGSGGVVDQAFEHSDLADVLTDGSGLAGCGASGHQYNLPVFTLARFGPDGQLDMNFGEDGQITLQIASGFNRPSRMARNVEGDFVVAGTTFNGTEDIAWALARFTDRGQVDTSFGDQGKVILNPTSAEDSGGGVLVDGQGRIVMTGATDGDAFVIARLLADGRPDPQFIGEGAEAGLVRLQHQTWSEFSTSGCLDMAGRRLVCLGSARVDSSVRSVLFALIP